MNQELEFGIVEVIGGAHKGKVGYYDDDHTPKTGVVFFGKPFSRDYAIINHKFLRNTDAAHLPTEKFKKESESTAIIMGLGSAGVK